MPVRRAGLRIRSGRRHHRHRPPKGERRKGGTRNQAIGRSRGGLTTKIVALVDALGNLVRFVLLPGQHHDLVGVRPLIEGVAFGALLGDKAFDADWLGAAFADRGPPAVPPPKATRKPPTHSARDMPRGPPPTETPSPKQKDFRPVPPPYNKTDPTYTATIHL